MLAALRSSVGELRFGHGLCDLKCNIIALQNIEDVVRAILVALKPRGKYAHNKVFVSFLSFLMLC
jgi:hypothetical protein